MALRDEIIWRSGIVYILIILVATAIMARVVIIQFVEGQKWTELGEQYIYKTDLVPANRGDILDSDGRVLASSVPFYNVYMDTRSTGMDSGTWSRGIDGLSRGLSEVVGLKSAAGWKRDLTQARLKGERYYLIMRRVSHSDLKRLQGLPIFREGRYKGGLIAEVESERIRPHNNLAYRTIGYLLKDKAGPVVGLEGAYDSELTGLNGTILKQRLTGGAWMPVNDENSVDPRDGNDIVTTIDIDLQDVAESALEKQLSLHAAHHGTAVLMEVKTGDIKAISNLTIGEDGSYHESYNYAIGQSTEPGSTFKLASFMVALEDGVVDLGDSISTGDGTVRYYDKTIRDSHRGGYGTISVKEVFELSSNVGTAMIINDNYKDRPGDFVDRLYRMGLNEKLGIEIKGEGAPLIRYPGDKYWSGISLPMMSHGYEVQLTPLQILTFYNAVANDGRMMKPRLVKEIRYHGQVLQQVETKVLRSSISSRATIKKAKLLLEGVVENGTATNLRNEQYKIAGKTGTAQIANEKYGYRQDGKVSYQASFVGYFPAEDPMYSCIVVVNAPTNSIYYGNLVAGPVFKEIADKVYSTGFYKSVDQGESPPNNSPLILKGYGSDTYRVLASLGLADGRSTLDAEWVNPLRRSDTLLIKEQDIIENLVPDVTGMGIRDALYLLENSGLKVSVKGRGRIVKQSLKPGTRIERGSTIELEMRI
ncbi:MAG: penicillin-binding protein [Marinilabiliaceae bacterium]|jgi:cell division protein FtsI (penicillin-binding protein 3)|nr:penicillin-binding protein [Marinilabiliaceae bacterium]